MSEFEGEGLAGGGAFSGQKPICGRSPHGLVGCGVVVVHHAGDVINMGVPAVHGCGFVALGDLCVLVSKQCTI